MISISKELRQAVLQAAIQGKLTKQLLEDGDAKDLLALIKAEKEQLIKEKKIKKEKPLSPITEDEVPFDIPENWIWVKLLEVLETQPSNGKSVKPTNDNKGIKNLTLTARHQVISSQMLLNMLLLMRKQLQTIGCTQVIC